MSESALIDGLLDPTAYPGSVDTVHLHETHISWVLTTGTFAYKVKKPVRLPFVDFSTLERRKRDCDEEVRLNRRMAPELYLGTVPISAESDRILVEKYDNVVEYAVKMRQFADSDRADQALRDGRLSAAQIGRFGAELARFHAAFDRSASLQYGAWRAVSQRLRKNLTELGRLLGPPDRRRLAAIAAWVRHELRRLRPVLARRAASGDCRECHGDLHLGNLVLIDGALVAFDCLEFDPALRWTDVADDLAFLAMDLELGGARGLAAVLIDAYLRETGDYGGIEVLDLYRAHRGLVRAKVAALAPAAVVAGSGRNGDANAAVRGHIDYVAGLGRRQPARLILMHGLPASGKSGIAAALVPELPAIRISSDVERKRSAGLARQARSGSGLGSGLYTRGRNEATYDRLASLARLLLAAGWHTIVDATFLRRQDRAAFVALADSLGCDIRIACCEAPIPELERRIAIRSRGRSDSEADSRVLEYARERYEPLSPAERRRAIEINTTGLIDPPSLAARLLGDATKPD